MQNKLTILVADDNVRAREALAGFLSVRLAGSLIIEAYDGMEAQKIITENHVDLVITDEVMPRKSGSILLKEVMNSDKACPFIIITGLRATDVHIEVKNSQKVRIMEKPVKFIELQKVIEELIGEAGMNNMFKTGT
jgi:DNA-binding NtrC family response regulator